MPNGVPVCALFRYAVAQTPSETETSDAA